MKLYCGDCLEIMKEMPDNSIDLVVTSPPYYNAKEYSHWNNYYVFLEWVRQIYSVIYSKVKKDIWFVLIYR